MKKDQTLVYIPPGAKINVDGKPMDMPIVKYERRRHRFDIEEVKKVTGGKYGRSAKLNDS